MSDDPSGTVDSPDEGPAAETQPRTADTGGPAPDTDDGSDGIDTTEYTTSIRTLDPRVRWLWVGRSLVVALVFGAIASGIAFVVDEAFLWVGPALFVVAATLGVAHSLLLFRSWEYRVRADSVYLDRGVLTQVQTVVPYVRVQHIDTSRGPIERLVGLSSLVVYTAGSRGADVTVPGLTPEEATDLQTRLKALAIESEGEDAV